MHVNEAMLRFSLEKKITEIDHWQHLYKYGKLRGLLLGEQALNFPEKNAYRFGRFEWQAVQ